MNNQAHLPRSTDNRQRRWTSSIMTPLLVCFVLPALAAAQQTSPAPVTSSVSNSSDKLAASASSSSIHMRSKTSSTARASSSFASSSVAASSTSPQASPLPPGATPLTPPSFEQQQKRSVVNLYFLLLALGAVIAFLAYWYFRRRRKEKMARSNDRRHTELARDLEGFTGPQRWMHGHWRGWSVPQQQRREEGFDERGEAPPPYQASHFSPAVTTSGNRSASEYDLRHESIASSHISRASSRAPHTSSSSEVSIPLRTFAPDERHPPRYEESAEINNRRGSAA